MSWLRVEGAARDPELTEGLAARVADPLWALARQWQVGEFHGEDAASPIVVQADVVHSPITAFAPPSGGTLDRADADRPLETLVEQESPDDDIRLTLEMGWLLLSSLIAAGASAPMLAELRKRYAASPPSDDGLDPVGRTQLLLLARRSFDGLRLASELAADPRAAGALLDDLGIPRGRRRAMGQILRAWMQNVHDFVRLPDSGTCWQPADLEYQFRVAAPLGKGELGLQASEYRGGSLDWYHFRRTPSAKPLGAEGRPRRHNITVLPTPLRFHGMPAARFWAVEDDSVSFGDLAAAPEDLVRAIIGGFSAVYADNWLVVPCILPAGSLARVDSLTVHDDYGETHRIRATAVLDGPDRVWRFFEIEGDDGPDADKRKDRKSPLMLLAPALPDVEEGPPLERVDLARDQVANMAWAIERRVVAAAGRSIDRDAAAAIAEPAESEEDWSYHAYTPVRPNWIPLVPVRRDDGKTAEVHLRRGRMAIPPPGAELQQLLPLGILLEPSKPLRIREEAIPDAGLRIDRRYQRTRGADGRVHLWIGRRVRIGAWPARGRFIPDRLVRAQQTSE